MEASRASPLPAGTYCPDCGYDLRGLTSDRCPECGFDLEPVRTQTPQIPWAHRRELGRIRAYWRTARLVSRRPRHFCLEMVRPVSERDAESFRRVTWWLAYAPILAGAVLWYGVEQAQGRGGAFTLGVTLAGLLLAVAFVLAAMPRLVAWLFASRRLPLQQRERAMLLSYYALAPLALMGLALPFFTAALLGGMRPEEDDTFLLLIGIGACGAVGVLLGAVVCYVGILNELAKHLLRLSLAQRLWRGLLLGGIGLLVALLALLIGAGIPYLAIMVDSLR